MKVLDVWSHIHPRYGGIGPAASALAVAVESSGNWTSDQIAICESSERERADNISGSVRTVISDRLRPLADVDISRSLRQAVSQSDVCHVHGMWLPHTYMTRRLARGFGKPSVSSVHGMLERVELGNKQIKKAMYSFLVEKGSLARSACLRALSAQEMAEFREYGLKNPVAVVPNGIEPLSRVDTQQFVHKHPELRNKQVVLFLSRIHKKKGILQLLEAWPEIRSRHSDAHLLVAGAEFGDTGELARRIIERHRLENSASFCGVLRGTQKLAALSLSRYFCLPSFSEGMSIAVLEALSIGVPVVITPACNVQGVAEVGAGLVSSNEPWELAANIIACLQFSDDAWNRMSASAQTLATERYDWAGRGRQMASVYEWLLGGPRPACVFD